MYVPNKSIEIFREGKALNRTQHFSQRVPACIQSGKKLEDCVLSKNIHILNHQKVRDNCEVEEWKNNCNFQWRKTQIEEIYRKGMNKSLYNQKDLDAYMKKKNNIVHVSLLG